MNYNPSVRNVFGTAVLDDEIFNLTLKAVTIDIDTLLEYPVKIAGFTVTLYSNIPHIANMWTSNFERANSTCEPDAKLYAIYTTDVAGVPNDSDLRDRILYCRNANSALYVNNDLYANAKVAYRGLIAKLCLIHKLVTFHSVALNVAGRNIIVTGPSGAGKSTLLSRIFAQKRDVWLHWEDWGIIDLASNRILNPNEINTHLKLNNIKEMLGNEVVMPKTYTEFYCDDFPNESARALVSLSKIGMPKGIDNTTNAHNEIAKFILLVPNKNGEQAVNKVSADVALDYFSSPTYSKTFKKNVYFFNGAIPVNEDNFSRYFDIYREYFSSISDHLYVATNNYTPFTVDTINTILNEV